MSLESLTIVVVTAYALGTALVVLGMRRGRDRAHEVTVGANPRPERVAIIVAARNEAGVIGACVRSILRQSARNFQLIVVDDRSSDGTGEAAIQAAEGDPRLMLVRLDDDSEGGKKRAISKGIEQADAELLLFTDADCEPAPEWAGRMTSSFDSETAFVAGYSPFQPRSGIFEHLTALETAANAVTASGLIGLGWPIMCTARNMAYRKSAYLAVGGFGEDIRVPSGDDTLMLQRIATGGGAVRYVFAQEAQVPTSPPASWSAWWRQKRRHLSTVRRYGAGGLMLSAVVRSMDVLIVAGVPLSIAGVVGLAPLWAFLAKALIDLGGLWIGLGTLGERRLLKVLPFLELVHSPLIVLGWLAGLFRRVTWK